MSDDFTINGYLVQVTESNGLVTTITFPTIEMVPGVPLSVSFAPGVTLSAAQAAAQALLDALGYTG